MSDVYVLASPAPILYAYPSQLHPAVVSVGGGGGRTIWPVQQPWPMPQPPIYETETDDDETALAVLGAL